MVHLEILCIFAILLLFIYYKYEFFLWLVS